MVQDFTKTSLDYNWGFIDGILWVAEHRNTIEFEDLISMVENIWKANDDIINEDAKRFEKLEKRQLDQV